ncbi:MAG: ArsC family reductase [Gammaproteobacteria bacterium]|nr:ArsC family reductase [Gammaproteobacteria bacterium]
MNTLYGIPNCDTVKKARRWLDANDINYTFHNFKKDGLTESLLDNWFDNPGWEVLLNKRGTTWRKLPEEVKSTINEVSARSIMLENNSIIKRPVLETGKQILVGFNEDEYSKIFL